MIKLVDFKIDEPISLPLLTKAPKETFFNWMQRRKACAGQPHEEYTNPWPLDKNDGWLYYPHFKVPTDKMVKQIDWSVGWGVLNNVEWKKRYSQYLESDKWKLIRSKKILEAGGKCQDCGGVYVNLQVHHLHYNRVGNEEMIDLQALCANCHIRADNERKRKTAIDIDNRAFNTFCVKKYGTEVNSFEAEREFEEWKEAKDKGYCVGYCSETEWGDV